MKTAFTLAEIMITLTVIGIISAIIMPIAINSVPDENVLKFKKANSTLYQVIQELVNSDKYYKDGDLGFKTDGTSIDSSTNEDDATYLCKTMADILSVKKTNCSKYLNTTSINSWYCSDWQGIEGFELKIMDSACKNMAKNVGEEIVLSDGTIIYQSSPAMTFGYKGIYFHADGSEHTSTTKGVFYDDKYANEGEMYRCSKVICIDIDGIDKGEDPFGYGIRADGKILPGQRAIEWLEKDIQGE